MNYISQKLEGGVIYRRFKRQGGFKTQSKFLRTSTLEYKRNSLFNNEQDGLFQMRIQVKEVLGRQTNKRKADRSVQMRQYEK